MGYNTLTAAVTGGVIFATRRDGDGPPAVILHEGPGFGAEMSFGLVEELDGLFETALPQQRGLYPSVLEGPRDVETHVADEISLLDQLGWERAWLIGHAWGGHLAMHVAVAHPERVSGLILVGTLGAVPDGGSTAFNQAMVDRLTADERATLDELLGRQVEGDPDPALMARIYAAIWPSLSYVHANVAPPGRIRLEKSLPDQPDTLASVRAHFDAGTLEQGLPGLDLPALLVHGEGDPMPFNATAETAALIRGAVVQVVDRGGHYPWIERRGALRELVAAFLGSLGS